MSSPKISEGEFIASLQSRGPTATAKFYGISIRRVFERRVSLERKFGIQITAPKVNNNSETRFHITHPGRLTHDISDGHVIIASDFHFWPIAASVCVRALVRACMEFKPKLLILNGDVVDLGQISRHPPIGWESMPKVADEIEEAKVRLAEIERALFKARKIWTLGNHDQRFEV